jgi:hypothetical protein
VPGTAFTSVSPTKAAYHRQPHGPADGRAVRGGAARRVTATHTASTSRLAGASTPTACAAGPRRTTPRWRPGSPPTPVRSELGQAHEFRSLRRSGGIRRLVRVGRDGPEDLRHGVASGEVSVKEADRRLAAARTSPPPGGPLILRARPPDSGPDDPKPPGLAATSRASPSVATFELVAIGGSAKPSVEKFTTLRSLGARVAYLAFDGDPPGKTATSTACRGAWEAGLDVAVCRCRTGQGPRRGSGAPRAGGESTTALRLGPCVSFRQGCAGPGRSGQEGMSDPAGGRG